MKREEGANRDKNLVLIGFMATGKTTIGRLVAAELGLSFIDTDREVERAAGMTISEIFARYGEKRFRLEEALVVKRVAAEKGAVIATGGGVVLNHENVTRLSDTGFLVCLKAPAKEILRRLGNSGQRPLARAGGREEILGLMRAREPLYRVADLVVENRSGDPQEVAGKIVAFWQGVVEGR